jgi:hypothetical protein
MPEPPEVIVLEVRREGLRKGCAGVLELLAMSPAVLSEGHSVPGNGRRSGHLAGKCTVFSGTAFDVEGVEPRGVNGMR